MTAPQPGQTSGAFRFFPFTLVGIVGIAVLAGLLAMGCAAGSGAPALDNSTAGQPARVAASGGESTGPAPEMAAAADSGLSAVANSGASDTPDTAAAAVATDGAAGRRRKRSSRKQRSYRRTGTCGG